MCGTNGLSRTAVSDPVDPAAVGLLGGQLEPVLSSAVQQWVPDPRRRKWPNQQTSTSPGFRRVVAEIMGHPIDADMAQSWFEKFPDTTK
jgi:hypothetical protein